MAPRHSINERGHIVATKIYKNLAKIVGIVLILVGIAATYGGNFASGFIKDQMAAQDITFPDEAGINAQVEGGSLTQDDADALMPYAGQQMTTGNQAKAYADNFIYAHMKAGAAAAGVPDATYASVGGMVTEETNKLIEVLRADNPNADDATLAKMAEVEIADPMTDYPEAQRAAELTSLRYDTLLDGNTLRGTLLNVYGWGLVGQIALYVGIGAIVVGVLLAIWGFVPGKKKEEA